MDIGNEIKRLRIKNGLTQEELADRCELSKGFISQIERNLASPSISTLSDILQCLGTDLKNFFNKESDEDIVFKADDVFVKEYKDEGSIINWIVPNSQKNDMETILLVLPENGESDTRYPFEGEEFGYVLEGKVAIEADGKMHTAKRGEAFYIDGAHEHKIINIGTKEAKIIWVTTPSNF